MEGQRIHASREKSEQYKTSGRSADSMASRDAQLQEAKREAGDLATKGTAEIDEILDEIDEVLEENAADFIRDYVQKGGQ